MYENTQERKRKKEKREGGGKLNFNPMDLILIKEARYEESSPQYLAVSRFICLLCDIQRDGLPEEIRKKMPDNGKYFDWKNELIEFALKGGK